MKKLFSKDRISEILEEIEDRKNELIWEYEKLRKKYDFSLERGKIKFSDTARRYQKKFKIPLSHYLIPKHFFHFLSIPFIYGMIVPALFLDICLFVYQNTAHRLYGIPLVRRWEYFCYDRKHLEYLNFMQKFNCIYCSYVNGLFSFAVEVAGRTEKYWCPIKAAKAKSWTHDWEKYFADYGDPKKFQQQFNSNKEYFKNHKKKKA